MTEDDIFAERAQLYAGSRSVKQQNESRCLSVKQAGVNWLFPKAQIRHLAKLERLTRLPQGALWENWPCLGMACQGQTVLPVLCWQMLVSGRELVSTSSAGLLLVLRHAPIALRVHDELAAVPADLEKLAADSDPWSLGRTENGEAVAKLDRFSDGGSR